MFEGPRPPQSARTSLKSSPGIHSWAPTWDPLPNRPPFPNCARRPPPPAFPEPPATPDPRARSRNRDALVEAVRSGRVEELLSSRVMAIEPDHVDVIVDDELRTIPNDDVIICAGGILPTQFLHDAGINVETKYGVV